MSDANGAQFFAELGRKNGLDGKEGESIQEKTLLKSVTETVFPLLSSQG